MHRYTTLPYRTLLEAFVYNVIAPQADRYRMREKNNISKEERARLYTLLNENVEIANKLSDKSEPERIAINAIHELNPLYAQEFIEHIALHDNKDNKFGVPLANNAEARLKVLKAMNIDRLIEHLPTALSAETEEQKQAYTILFEAIEHKLGHNEKPSQETTITAQDGSDLSQSFNSQSTQYPKTAALLSALSNTSPISPSPTTSAAPTNDQP